MTRNESAAETTAEDMELELDFFLRLVNSRRSRRGDWDSIILEHSHLHLTVPDAIERATWMPSTSTLVVTVNLEPSSAPLPLLEDLSIFIPHDAPPFCYASAEATAGAASIADAITSKLQPQGCFLALTVFHAIELALKTVGFTTEERLDVRRMAEDRILAKVAAHRDACDVLMCLLVAAVSSPKGLRPWPAHFSSAQQDVDRTHLSHAIARVPTLSSLPKDILFHIYSAYLRNLPAESVHLLDWLWCRVPMTLEQVQNIQVQVPSLSGLRDLCFGAQVIQSANPWFDSMVAKHGSKLCFHGSRFGSFHSIIQNGLQSMSGTRHMSSGNVFGDGIYFADSVSVSSQFASPASSTAAWSRSQVLSKAAICIAVCEVILNPQVTTHLPSQGDGSYYVVQDERFVRLRYLVLCQPPSSLRQTSPRSISWPAVVSFILVLLVAVTSTLPHPVMNDALRVYKPPKRPRKKRVDKLRPLIAPHLAKRWREEAVECTAEMDFQLQWIYTSRDKFIESLQTTWLATFGKSRPEAYCIHDVTSPESSMLCQESFRLCRLASERWMRVLSTIAIRPTRNDVALPVKSKPRRWIAYSIEMRDKLQQHLREKCQGTIWQDEVRSRLARPLDATAFVDRSEQLLHSATSQSLADFQVGDANVLLYPYSTEAHKCASKIARCYLASCARVRLRVCLHQLRCAIRFLQDVLRFRVHCKIQYRRRQAVKSIFARRIQRSLRFHLSTKHALATRIQSLWRVARAKKWLLWEKKLHLAAASIGRAAKRYVWLQKHRHGQATRIQIQVKAWLWRLHRRYAETVRAELEAQAVELAAKVAVQKCMEYLLTPDGKAAVKRERLVMKEEMKRAGPLAQAAHEASMDLETLAIRNSFDAFDTDGSGHLDLAEFRLVVSSLGVPISESELLVGFQEMDTDGSGTIEFDEFAQWWRTGLTTSGPNTAKRTQMALLRLKLRGQSFVKRITGAEAKARAAKRITTRQKHQAMMDARQTFRLLNPPACVCHGCSTCFALEREWFLHRVRHGCTGHDPSL
ncbi:hypothetical protein AeMF1_001540 [Aphanomyces euteiches]|nr:hypothetical protein AeMF1_001540 [Aphanomyces euteiches]